MVTKSIDPMVQQAYVSKLKSNDKGEKKWR